MDLFIFIAIMAAIGTINYVLSVRENKKTFAALKEYMADPMHLSEVLIDNEKGYSEGRIHFLGGNTYYYNNVMRNEKLVLSILASGNVNVLEINDHVYGLPEINYQGYSLPTL
jgi:hypothetical protein